MTEEGGWMQVHLKPRDGVPVILWMAEDESPPVLPLTVWFWTSSPQAGVCDWRLFGDPPRFCSDKHIRGWKPLLHNRSSLKRYSKNKPRIKASITKDKTVIDIRIARVTVS
jgi:hypothetical protein